MTDPESRELAERAEDVRVAHARVREEIARVVVGNDAVVEGVLTCLFAGGHALLEGVPGLGKTLVVRTLAEAVDLRFSRIQFTPDLMPADITGTSVLWEGPAGERQFRFQRGPVFANILLADEINRATPKTQSAMLEAMQEHAVTAAGERHVLEEPFVVLATQNPIEMEGTYPLPEAQLDRFMLKLLVDPPTFEQLGSIVSRTTGAHLEHASPVLDAPRLLAMRDLVRRIELEGPVRDLAVRVVMATHPTDALAPEAVRRYVRFGASPRGAQAIAGAARVRALLDGRYNVAFEDVGAVALPALRHRLLVNFEGQAEGVSPDSLVGAALAAVLEGADPRAASGRPGERR